LAQTNRGVGKRGRTDKQGRRREREGGSVWERRVLQIDKGVGERGGTDS
jgi:hypothetical protein